MQIIPVDNYSLGLCLTPLSTFDGRNALISRYFPGPKGSPKKSLFARGYVSESRSELRKNLAAIELENMKILFSEGVLHRFHYSSVRNLNTILLNVGLQL